MKRILTSLLLLLPVSLLAQQGQIVRAVELSWGDLCRGGEVNQFQESDAIPTGHAWKITSAHCSVLNLKGQAFPQFHPDLLLDEVLINGENAHFPIWLAPGRHTFAAQFQTQYDGFRLNCKVTGIEVKTGDPQPELQSPGIPER